MQVVLTVNDGPMAGRKCWVATGQAIRVGRTAAADFIFDRDGEMSSLHFEVSWHDGAVVLRDLGSTNGTFVDGVQVGEKQLISGSMIRAGRTTFEVTISEAAPDEGSAEFDNVQPAETSPISRDVSGAPYPSRPASVASTADRYGLQLTSPTGQIHRVSIGRGQSLIIGRTEQADVCVAEDAMISSLHLRIELDEDTLRFRDLNSTNGVLLNSKRVESGTLSKDDEIQIGQSYLTITEIPSAWVAEFPTTEAAKPSDALDDATPTENAEEEQRAYSVDSPIEASEPGQEQTMEPPDEPVELADGGRVTIETPSASQDAVGADTDERAERPSALCDEPVITEVAPIHGSQPSETSTPTTARSDAQSESGESASDVGEDLVGPSEFDDGSELEIVIVDVVLRSQPLRKFWLTPGQAIIVGNGPGSDELIADDGLAANQWLVQANSTQCTLTLINENPPSLIDGKPFADSARVINDGQRVSAASTELLINVVKK